jgi:hypothetical protein
MIPVAPVLVAVNVYTAVVQVDETHARPPVQRKPHDPQLLESVVRSTHTPLQFVVLPGQTAQTPPEQYGVEPEHAAPLTQCPVESHDCGVVVPRHCFDPGTHVKHDFEATSQRPGPHVVTVSHERKLASHVCSVSPLQRYSPDVQIPAPHTPDVQTGVLPLHVTPLTQ